MTEVFKIRFRSSDAPWIARNADLLCFDTPPNFLPSLEPTPADLRRGYVRIVGVSGNVEEEHIRGFFIGGSADLIRHGGGDSHERVEGSLIRLTANPTLIRPNQAFLTVRPPDGVPESKIDLSLLVTLP